MRDGLVFRSALMGGSGTTELTWLCDVENGSIHRVHTSNTAQTAAQYYAYASQRYNGPDSADGTILIRFHRNINTKELSLIVVGQSDGTSTVGPILITVSGLNASSYVSVQDDNGETTKNSSSHVDSTLLWSADRTDGFAISGIDSSIVSNIVITFNNPYPTMNLKIQTSPNVFSYIRQDKMTTLQFRATNTDPCDRYVYPPGQAFIVDTPAELASATGPASTPPTPEDVFNSWGRYAGPDWYPSGTTPEGEATSWVFDSGTNRVSSTINSTNYIGFVSPETLSFFTLTTTLGSTNADDDLIGVVVAFYLNGSVPTTICAVRANNGSIGGRTWALIQVASNTVTILVDGSASAPSAYGSANVDPLTRGWSASGPTTVQVKRDGRNITATCSQFTGGTGEALDPSTTISYTIPASGIFDADRSYGFMCQSQTAAYFDIVNFTGGLDQSTVYDFSQLPPRVFEYTGSAWVVNPNRSVFVELGQPRTVSNPSTGKTYYLDNNTATIVP